MNQVSKKLGVTELIVIIIAIVIGIGFYVNNKFIDQPISDLTLRDPNPKAPLDGCVWHKYISNDLKIGLWAQNCIETSMVPEVGYEFGENALLETSSRNGIEESLSVIRIFNKNEDESIEDFLNKNFKTGLDNFAHENCVVERLNAFDEIMRHSMPAGIERYHIKPNDELLNEAKSTRGEGPGAWSNLCGSYGLTNSRSYFQYHPNEDKGRVLWIFEGQDTPFFDPNTIKLF